MSQTRNLVHDTWARRTRQAVMNAAHGADDFLSRRADVRILFEAASPMSLATFAPVLAHLQSDPRLAFWFTTADRAWDPALVFDAQTLATRFISPSRARWTKFDAYVNTDFWNMTWLHRRALRIHLFHGVAGKYGLDAPTSIAPVVATFDRLLFPNQDRRQRYVEAGLVDGDGPKGVLAGYPKVDCLVDGSLDRQAIGASLGLDPSRPTVLYAPTWSPYSSLTLMGLDIVNALLRLDVNVVVKLHDRSAVHTERGSGGLDWPALFEPLVRASHLHLARGADASPYLFVADALVTDHSSVGFEFMLLDRPIVVVDCPELLERARVSPQKARLLRSAAAVVTTADAAAQAVLQALSNPSRLGERRRAIAAELFYRAGGATARAVQSIYEVLTIPAIASPESSRVNQPLTAQQPLEEDSCRASRDPQAVSA